MCTPTSVPRSTNVCDCVAFGSTPCPGMHHFAGLFVVVMGGGDGLI